MIQKMTLGSTAENTAGTTLVKISVTFFVLRLIQGTHAPVRWTLYAQLMVLIPITIATFSLLLVQCRPMEKYWNPAVPGYCLSGSTVSEMLKANNGEFRHALLLQVPVY